MHQYRRGVKSILHENQSGVQANWKGDQVKEDSQARQNGQWEKTQLLEEHSQEALPKIRVNGRVAETDFAERP